MSQVILACQGITKSYRSGLHSPPNCVLSDCSLEIREEESVGLRGPSGSGKSTFGKILTGLECPDQGRVYFNGKDIHTTDTLEWNQYRRSVQMLFQDPGGVFHPKRTIRSSLLQVLHLYHYPPQHHDTTLRHLITLVGVQDEIFSRYPDQISGGQAQRLALARILLTRPRIIILDEPTSGLDISVQAQILHLLKDVQKKTGLSYLLISHDPDVIHFFCTRILVLEGGSFVTFPSP